MTERLGACPDGAVACREQDPDRFSFPSSAGLREVRAGECLACCAVGVERVGLRAVAASGSRWTVDLHDPLTLRQEIGDETGAEAAGAFDRPDAPRLFAGVLGGPGEHASIPERVGRDGHVVELTPAVVDDAKGVGLFVGVDPDDEVDLICETHLVLLDGVLVIGAANPEPRGKTVTGHARRSRADRLLIRPTCAASRPTSVRRRTYPQEGHPPTRSQWDFRVTSDHRRQPWLLFGLNRRIQSHSGSCRSRVGRGTGSVGSRR